VPAQPPETSTCSIWTANNLFTCSRFLLIPEDLTDEAEMKESWLAKHCGDV